MPKFADCIHVNVLGQLYDSVDSYLSKTSKIVVQVSAPVFNSSVDIDVSLHRPSAEKMLLLAKIDPYRTEPMNLGCVFSMAWH